MKLVRHIALAASAFALSATPVLAADAKADLARAASPVGQTEQVGDDEEGGGWILWALAGIALAAGLILVLDDPASP